MLSSLLKIIILLFPLILTGCDKIKFGSGEKIKPSETYSLKIPEPSGVALHNGKLWIVSDRNSTVYKTNLKGEIESEFKLGKADLEGITVIDDSLLAVVLEISRKVVITDFYGNEIFRTSLEVEGSKNSGLEGITYNSSNGHLYILNEKDPVLLTETDRELNEMSRIEIKDVKDLSGVSYSAKENCLWLISDEERKIIKFPLPLSEENGISESPSLREGFRMGSEYRITIDQAEGIAVDDENNLLYVVSDKEEKLYVFEIE
jgi:uncharacterized protein YjiK